jgi:hypothetical protein
MTSRTYYQPRSDKIKRKQSGARANKKIPKHPQSENLKDIKRTKAKNCEHGILYLGDQKC